MQIKETKILLMNFCCICSFFVNKKIQKKTDEKNCQTAVIILVDLNHEYLHR